MNDNAIPASKPICDIILKGGLTSGIVYPRALVKLAEQYRFSCIGGTSAGAIAAAAAAAAEYGRRNEYDGFARLAKIPGELGQGLLALFQPTPALKPVYDTFIAVLNAGTASAAMGPPVKAYWPTALVGTIPGLVIFLLAIAADSGWCAAFGLVLALAGAVVALVGRVILANPMPLPQSARDTFTGLWSARGNAASALAALWTPIKGYRWTALAGIAPGILIVVFGREHAGWVFFGLLVALVGLVGAVVGRFAYAAFVELVKNDYGLCPGIRQPYSANDGFTDWLAKLIDEAAGPRGTNDPLTFGDLASAKDQEAPIKLAMMTTSLMEMRPYTLPIRPANQKSNAPAPGRPQAPAGQAGAEQKDEHNIFFFEKGAWEKLFPARIIAYLVAHCDRFVQQHGEAGEFYYFPDETHLPLVVAARMSLSFPGLICAVPLWRRDFTLLEEADRQTLRPCLFSDGGLSSNFPIHFFDHLLPRHPTFAVSLDEFDAKRNVDHVWMPKPDRAASGSGMPIVPFEGLLAFMMRLIDSAKNWQDSLQSVLPGYRERIVHVCLEDDVGGINLTMDSKTIEKLAEYGETAGTLCTKFDLNSHRWRRFLVAMARMEETLDEVATAYREPQAAVADYARFLPDYSLHPDHYAQAPSVREAMLARGTRLADTGVAWRTPPRIRDGYIPQPPTNLRITPKY
jgi:predicted acylesterase/phospholipase RssA